ncbi:unnamed protein product, partial [marine sediment metagenome]
ALLLPKHKLYLIGMDFKRIVGKYSKLEYTKNQEANPIKLKKLQYAVKLIEWLRDKIKNEIYIVNSDFVSRKFINLSIREFEEIISV